MTETAEVVAVDGREIRLTNPDRVLWPVTGTTKRDLIAYQLAIAPLLLPYLRRRATMLWRFPAGVDGPGWFQANCRGRPDWLAVHEIVGLKGQTLSYCLVEEAAALVWLANLGTIELHPHLWTVEAPTEPTWLVFDLDPGPPAGLPEAARVAVYFRARLEADGLPCVVKTSGGLGLHVLVPLAPGETFERAKTYARTRARGAARALPDLVIERSTRADRAGRVYIDWIQNDPGRQLVAPYSLRATSIPSASTPVTWDEVEQAASNSGATRLRFTPRDVIARAERHGDLLATISPGRLPGGFSRDGVGPDDSILGSAGVLQREPTDSESDD